MIPEQGAGRRVAADVTSALPTSDATINWLSSVGYDAPGTAYVPAHVRGVADLEVRRHDRVEVPETWAPVVLRRTALRRYWPAVTAVALVSAIVTYLVSGFLTPTYSASSVVRVTTGTGVLSSRDSVTASNELAAQFSQLIETTEVRDRAAEKAGVSAGELDGRVTATVLSNQNLIQVTAKGDTPGAAQKVAAAAASVLTEAARASLVDTVSPVVAEQLTQLENSIEQTQEDLDAAQRKATSLTVGTSTQAAAQSRLNGLVQQLGQFEFRRVQLQQDSVINAAERQVLLTGLGSSGAPVKESPRPALYAIIALAFTGVLGANLASVFNGRRRDHY